MRRSNPRRRAIVRVLPTEPRVILITLPPPLNGGVFGASEPYASVP